MSTMMGMGGMTGAGMISPFIFTVYFLLIALVYLFPVLYLYRFSTKMQTALRSDNEAELTASFSNLKSLYKFMGILTAIFIGLYALIFVFAGLAGAAAGF
ncbi:MAG: DUF5362 family protein [Saprospiraceae bacterium]